MNGISYHSRLVVQAFIDSLPHSNRSVIFGPACDLALAQVARLLKVCILSGTMNKFDNLGVLSAQYYNTPLITSGGFSSSYSESKTKPEDEYYLLTRTGLNYM